MDYFGFPTYVSIYNFLDHFSLTEIYLNVFFHIFSTFIF